MPLVTVIIPTVNRVHLIERALISACNQTIRDIEILVCDDASTDATRDVVRSFQKRDSRIELLCLSENQGAAAARNLGLKAFRGKYVAFLDSDDEWLPEKLEHQVEHMNSKPEEVGVCFCGARIIKNGDPDRPILYIPKREWELDTLRQFVNGRIMFLTPTILFRSSCLKKVGVMVREMRRNQDMEFLLRLFLDYTLSVIQQPFVVVHLVVSSKNTYFNDLQAALPYHLRHCDIIRHKLGLWSAATYKARMFHFVLCEAVQERRWDKILYYFSQRIRANPFFSSKDVAQLLKAFYRCLFR